MHVLKVLLHAENHNAIKEMGYYPCKQNILIELQYYNPMGLNQAMPSNELHVILMGYFKHLIQVYSAI